MFSLQPLMSTVCSVLIFLKMGSLSQISSIFCVKTSKQHRPRQTFFHLNNGLYCFFFKKLGGTYLSPPLELLLCVIIYLLLGYCIFLVCASISFPPSRCKTPVGSFFELLRAWPAPHHGVALRVALLQKPCQCPRQEPEKQQAAS